MEQVCKCCISQSIQLNVFHVEEFLSSRCRRGCHGVVEAEIPPNNTSLHRTTFIRGLSALSRFQATFSWFPMPKTLVKSLGRWTSHPVPCFVKRSGINIISPFPFRCGLIALVAAEGGDREQLSSQSGLFLSQRLASRAKYAM